MAWYHWENIGWRVFTPYWLFMLYYWPPLLFSYICACACTYFYYYIVILWNYLAIKKINNIIEPLATTLSPLVLLLSTLLDNRNPPCFKVLYYGGMSVVFNSMCVIFIVSDFKITIHLIGVIFNVRIKIYHQP